MNSLAARCTATRLGGWLWLVITWAVCHAVVLSRRHLVTSPPRPARRDRSSVHFPATLFSNTRIPPAESKMTKNIAYISGGGGVGDGNCESYTKYTDGAIYQSSDFIIDAAKKESHANGGGGVGGAEQADDPSAHKVEYPTTYWDTLLHVFKGNVGSGLLAMGDAFRNGGLVFATVMTVVLGVANVHAQHILLNCSDELRQRTAAKRPPGFAETVELGFATGPESLRRLASTMKLLVNVFLCITQLGFCCVYIVFIATNVQKICEQYQVDVQLAVVMVYVVMPILASCCVRNLKFLSPVSSVANVCMIVGVCIVVYEASRDLPPLDDRQYMASWSQLPLFFSTTVYAFEGIGLVLPLKSEMRNPEAFQKPLGVLNVGMTVVGSMYIVVGFLGYLKWGEDVQGSLTLNMPPGKVLSNVVQVLIATGILFSYPLQMYVPVDIMWPALQRRLPAKLSCGVADIVFRVLLVLLTFALAESIPQLGLFISLIGAVSSTALALIFPPLLELVMAPPPPMLLLKNVLIIILGFYIFIAGTYESVSAIVSAFSI